MMKTEDFMEFREVADGADDEALEVYFMGVHVHTIRKTWTRPGGEVYVEKEQCVRRAERALKHIWVTLGAP